MIGSFKKTWHDSIEDISLEEWNDCFGSQHVLRSYAFHRAVERSRLKGIAHRYLRIAEDGKVLAIIPAFTYDFSLAILANPKVRSFIDSYLKFGQRFLRTRAFIAGSPIAMCNHLLGIHPDAMQPWKKILLLSEAQKAIEERAKSERCQTIVFKEFRDGDKEDLIAAFGDSYHIVPSLPDSSLGLSGKEGPNFLARLNGRYRQNISRNMRQASASGLDWDVLSEITEAQARQIHELYKQVWKNSAVNFEELNPQFFQNILSDMPGNCFMLIAQKNGKIIAYELFLHNEHEIIPLYLGMDYELRDQSALYFNLLYKAIFAAEERGYSAVHFGQTSYDVKAALGCQKVNLSLAVRSTNPLVHHVMGQYRSTFFPETAFPKRDVFKSFRTPLSI